MNEKLATALEYRATMIIRLTEMLEGIDLAGPSPGQLMRLAATFEEIARLASRAAHALVPRESPTGDTLRDLFR